MLILFYFIVGSLKKKKVYIPVRENPDINFLGKTEIFYSLQISLFKKVYLLGRGVEHKRSYRKGREQRY